MYKKSISGLGILFGLLLVGGTQVNADELTDISELNTRVEQIYKAKKQMVSDREDLVKEIELSNLSNIKEAPSKSKLEHITELNKVVYFREVVQSSEDLLKESETRISELNQNLENVEKELTEVKNFDNLLDSSVSGLTYDKESMSVDELKAFKSTIESRKVAIESSNVEVEDVNKVLETTELLNKSISKIQTDIENYVSLGQKIVNQSKTYLGVPYVWGGKSANGLDCSGLTSRVFREVYGKEIGSVTTQQENSGTVISVSEAKEGDLYFWGSHGSTYHVGIAIGDGTFVHAPVPGDVVKITHINDFMPSFALRVI